MRSPASGGSWVHRRKLLSWPCQSMSNSFFLFSSIFFATVDREICPLFFINFKGSLFCFIFSHSGYPQSQRKIPPAFLFLYPFMSINLSKFLWFCFLCAMSGCVQAIWIKSQKGWFVVPVDRHERSQQHRNVGTENLPGCAQFHLG